MTREPQPSVAAALWALFLALIAAILVMRFDWAPWDAIWVVGGGALLLALLAVAGLLLMAGSAEERRALRAILVATVRSDLQPFVELWQLLRGRGR